MHRDIVQLKYKKMSFIANKILNFTCSGNGPHQRNIKTQQKMYSLSPPPPSSCCHRHHHRIITIPTPPHRGHSQLTVMYQGRQFKLPAALT